MKFLSWFLGIILLISSVFVFGYFNFQKLFFSPTSLKTALVKIDFYDQAKAIIKSDIFESADKSTSEEIALSKSINQVLETYDFQPKIEKLIDDFFASIKNSKNGQMLTVDLSDIKNRLRAALSSQIGSSEDVFSEVPIPDNWQVDLSQYSTSLSVASFFYRNSTWIYLIFALLFLLFFFACLKVGVKYLKVFFAFTLIIGILLFLQFVFLQIVNLGAIFSKITQQGQGGLTIIMENLFNYIRTTGRPLILWESLSFIAVSIIGFIVVGVTTKEKVGKIPLNEKHA